MVSDRSLFFEKFSLYNPVVSVNLFFKEERHMIQKIITFICPRCGSDNLVKNGRNKVNSQQAHCKDCDAYFVLEPKTPHDAETKKNS